MTTRAWSVGTKRSRVAGAALGLMLAVLPLTPIRAGSGSCYKYSKLDRKLATKTNWSRANNGVAKLTLDPQLSRVAKKHTKAMVAEGELFHTPGDVLANRVTKWSILGENVGVAGTVKKLHKAFMASAGHKANILNGAYKYIGVKVINSGGKVWATVLFEGAKNPGTTLKMPSC